MAKDKFIPVKPHQRRRPGPPVAKTPMPGANEFDAGQEQAMRQGRRADLTAPPGDDGEPAIPASQYPGAGEGGM